MVTSCFNINPELMKLNHFVYVALLFFYTSVSAQTYHAPAWAKIRSEGKGTIKLAYVETPKFVYRDASGNLTGICIDIMDDFVKWVNTEKKVAIHTEFTGEGSNFHTMYEKVKSANGGVFGLGNITITDERKKEVKFSPPFITNFAILVSNANLPIMNRMEDMETVFKGARAYSAKGTTNETRMIAAKKQYFPEMQLSGTNSSQETLEKIVSDAKGFGYLDLAFYLDAIQLKKNIRRHPVGDKAAEQFGFIMPLNSDWQPLMEEFFKANGGYVTTERYRTILQKHLGETGMKLLRSSSGNKI